MNFLGYLLLLSHNIIKIDIIIKMRYDNKYTKLRNPLCVSIRLKINKTFNKNNKLKKKSQEKLKYMYESPMAESWVLWRATGDTIRQLSWCGHLQKMCNKQPTTLI